MDAAIKQKWVTALRSGDYLQARGALRKGKDGYCCLGVLCRVAKISIASDGKACSHHRDYSPIYELIGAQTGKYLMGLNDRNYASFSEIADYVEKTL